MAAAYIEPRPKSREPHTAIADYTIVSGGQDHGEFKTQDAAIDHACQEGYRPVHVARVRHIPDPGDPDHFRDHPCPKSDGLPAVMVFPGPATAPVVATSESVA